MSVAPPAYAAAGVGGRRPTACARCTAPARRRSSPSTASTSTSRRPVHRDHGPVRLRQVDADALPGRARRPPPARCASATPTSTGLDDKRLTLLRRDRVGFVFQAFNLLPTLTAEENITLPLALAGRKPDRSWLRPRSSTASACATGCATGPPSSPAASSSGSPCARALVSRPEVDLRRRADRQPRLPLRRRGAAAVPAQAVRRARPDRSSWSPTTRSPPAYADRVVFLADGRLVGELDRADRRARCSTPSTASTRPRPGATGARRSSA